jgi:ATP-dependent Zn protease
VTIVPTLRRTAWHEAGHAVVAWERGLTVVLVSIRPEVGSFGRATHKPAGNCTIPAWRERENIVAMGGWAAEQASGEANDGHTFDGGDMSWVLSRIPDGRVPIELGWAEQEAERIVRENMARVERLAGVLLERTELTDAAEIRAIINGDLG